MSTITVNAEMQSVLLRLKGATEIRGVSGNLLGIFTPSEVADEKAIYETAKQMFDPAEIERRLGEDGGKGSSLEDVWKRLHARINQ